MLDFGILGQPYLDLEPYLDMTGIEDVAEEIVYGIAKHRSLDYAYLVYGDDQRPTREGLDHFSTALYDSFYEDNYPHAGFTMSLRRGNGPIHRAASNPVTAIAEDFPLMMAFVDRLPFVEVGRINIWYNTPGVASVVHRDFSHELSKFVPFIYFNPLLTKRFFVMDRNRGRHYLETKAAIFNPQDRHGADPTKNSTFAIRVDGVFTEEFLERTGLSVYNHLFKY